MPRVDVFMLGFLAGCFVAIWVMYAAHVAEVRRIERRHAFGLKRHPAFRDWRP